MDKYDIEREKELNYTYQSKFLAIEFWNGEKYRVPKRENSLPDDISSVKYSLGLIQLAEKVVDLQTARILKGRYGSKYLDFDMAFQSYEWPILSEEKVKILLDK